MKLKELDPFFLKWIDESHRQRVYTLAEADGIMFVCPKCFHDLGGRAGAHSVICWFTGHVPDTAVPGPGRWQPSGTGIDDLSFIGTGSISIQLIGGCAWHGYIRNGETVDA